MCLPVSRGLKDTKKEDHILWSLKDAHAVRWKVVTVAGSELVPFLPTSKVTLVILQILPCLQHTIGLLFT